MTTEYLSNGESVCAYCKRNQLSYNQFYRLKLKHGNKNLSNDELIKCLKPSEERVNARSIKYKLSDGTPVVDYLKSLDGSYDVFSAKYVLFRRYRNMQEYKNLSNDELLNKILTKTRKYMKNNLKTSKGTMFSRFKYKGKLLKDILPKEIYDSMIEHCYKYGFEKTLKMFHGIETYRDLIKKYYNEK